MRRVRELEIVGWWETEGNRGKESERERIKERRWKESERAKSLISK